MGIGKTIKTGAAVAGIIGQLGTVPTPNSSSTSQHKQAGKYLLNQQSQKRGQDIRSGNGKSQGSSK